MATSSSATTKNNLQRGDYVSIRDPRYIQQDPEREDGWMPTINGYTHGTYLYSLDNTHIVVIELPNGVRQRLPVTRCNLLKSKEDVMLYVLKNGLYQK